MRIFGVDPGQKRSGWCIFDTDPLEIRFGHDWNRVVIETLNCEIVDVLGYEWIQSYGLAVGEDVFRTAYMCGRLREAFGGEFHEPTRPQIVRHFTGRSTHKKPVVRQVLRERFEGNNDMLKGITNHAWDALAVCLFLLESVYEKRIECCDF